MFGFLAERRKKKYREEYRQMSEEEKDEHMRLMTHYSVYGGPFRNKVMVEMCEAAMEVEDEGDL